MTSCSIGKVAVVAASDSKEATDEQRRGISIRHDQTITNRMDAFPWITEFRTMSRLPQRPGSLMKLISFFNKQVSSSVADCYKKSSRAARLKDLIKEALLLFMYLHRFEQPQDQNRAVYLEQMSDLLAVYVDLELIASKREAEPQPCRISARLVSSLCLCLENSTEHLLDTLIKVQLVNETFSDILDPVISKVIKLAPPPPKSKLNGMAYVRYLLVYRLWKRMHINLAARKNIVSAAIEALRFEPPSDVPEAFVQNGVLPSSQNNQMDKPTTKHYLCQSYDLRNACVQFIKYSRCQSVDESTTTTSTSSSSSSIPSTASNSSSSSECSERDPRLKKSTLTSAISESRCSVNTALTRPSKNVNKSCIPLEKVKTNSEKSRACIPKSLASANTTKSSKQLDDIVLIDLTDEEVTKIVKRKKRGRISWLDEAKRNLHTKIASMKIEESSNRRSTSSFIAEEQTQAEKLLEQQLSSSSSSSSKSNASALSNGCSVIRETGRPAVVVTPKTDIIEPKVQEEAKEAEQVDSAIGSEQSTPTELTAEVTSSTPTSNYYDGIDGLTLLASVSAQQQITPTTKKPELKVKPYTTLQQPMENLTDNDNMDKLALQVDFCSSEQQQLIKPENNMYSYVLEEQSTLEANDNANVILNGETVMLLQKSPNSNLYIINKAAIDSSKLNYNSDEEMMGMGLEMPEDVKPTLKMETVMDYPTYPPPHCMHQLSVDCACVSCAYCRPYFLPAPASNDKDKALVRFKDFDSKLPLKKRLKAQRMMDFAQTDNHTVPALELGAVVEVSTSNKPRGRGAKKDKSINQNVPNCFPRKPGPKKRRVTPADEEVENNVLVPPAKKARRSSRRGVTTVSYVDHHEHEADCNPSARQRKKKRSTR